MGDWFAMYQRFMKIGSMDWTVPMKTRSLAPTSWQLANDVSHSHALSIMEETHKSESARSVTLEPQP